MIEIRDHGKTALIYRGKEISYAELIENVGSFARLVSTLPGERVAIISENRPEWVYALFGIWRRGSVAVPIDFMSTPEEIAYILKDSGSRMVFCSNQTHGNLMKALERVDTHVEVVNFDEVLLPKPYERAYHREPDDPALILYTSGTTGNPKGVVLTFLNLLSNIEGVAEKNIAGRDDSTLAILPFHHSYPLMVTLLLPLHLGATIVFLDKLTHEDIIQKLQSYRITILVGVPRLFELLSRRIMERIEENLFARLLMRLMERMPRLEPLRRRVFYRVHEAFGGNTKYMVSGGAKLDLKVLRDLTTLGFTLLEGYGLTETSPIVSFNTPKDNRLGSVGLPLRGVMVRITEEGEILVKGPNVMKGYWNRPKETAEVIRDGWLYTGDLGYVDEDGFLYITGRKKEVIVLGTGKNVNPEEIESMILRESDLVKEVGVLEVGGKLVALIYPDLEKVREKGIVNIEETIKWEVIDRVNRKLPEWKRLAGFKLSSAELPKTRLGKLRRFMLRDIYERATWTQKVEEDISVFQTEEGRLVRDYLRKETGREVLPSHHLELDLGLDSLGKLELLSFIDKTFGVSLREEELSKHMLVGDLIELVRERKERMEMGETSWREILEGATAYDLEDYPSIFRLGRFLLSLFFKLYNRAQIECAFNLPEKPFILAPNHASYLDAFLIAALVPEEVGRDLYFLGEETYFKNPIASLFGRLAHVITVNTNRALRESLQKVAFALKRGKVVVVFPEGARTRTGELLEFKKGVAVLSKELGIPIVPAGIVGTYEAMSINDRFPRPVKLKLRIGKPIYPDGRSYEEITSQLRSEVERLLKDGCS